MMSVSDRIKRVPNSLISRRLTIQRFTQIAGGAVLLASPARFVAAAGATPTPAQVEGPFYPSDMPAETDWNLLKVGDGEAAAGEPLALTGQVILASGAPVAGARVELWQCDGGGVYDHPNAPERGSFDRRFQGFGAINTDAEGRYRFLTIMPVPYPGRPPHIHIKIRRGRRQALTTQLYLKDHPENNRDGLLSLMLYPGQHKLLIDPRDADLENGMRGKAAEFDFVL